MAWELIDIVLLVQVLIPVLDILYQQFRRFVEVHESLHFDEYQNQVYCLGLRLLRENTSISDGLELSQVEIYLLMIGKIGWV